MGAPLPVYGHAVGKASNTGGGASGSSTQLVAVPSTTDVVAGTGPVYHPFCPLGADGLSLIVVVGGTVILRIAPSFASATRRPPSGVGDTPAGPSNDAEVAAPPSPAKLATPLPATVVTVPVAETARIRSLLVSAIRKRPSAVLSTCSGMFSRAATAGPPSPP